MCIRDRPEVARRVTEAGAGTSLPFKKLSPERVLVGILDAMAMRPGVEAASKTFRNQAGTERFVEAVEDLAPVMNGGSRLSPSPAVAPRRLIPC